MVRIRIFTVVQRKRRSKTLLEGLLSASIEIRYGIRKKINQEHSNKKILSAFTTAIFHFLQIGPMALLSMMEQGKNMGSLFGCSFIVSLQWIRKRLFHISVKRPDPGKWTGKRTLGKSFLQYHRFSNGAILLLLCWWNVNRNNLFNIIELNYSRSVMIMM